MDEANRDISFPGFGWGRGGILSPSIDCWTTRALSTCRCSSRFSGSPGNPASLSRVEVRTHTHRPSGASGNPIFPMLYCAEMTREKRGWSKWRLERRQFCPGWSNRGVCGYMHFAARGRAASGGVLGSGRASGRTGTKGRFSCRLPLLTYSKGNGRWGEGPGSGNRQRPRAVTRFRALSGGMATPGKERESGRKGV